MSRIDFTEDRDYYVDAVHGVDTNDGLYRPAGTAPAPASDAGTAAGGGRVDGGRPQGAAGPRLVWYARASIY